MTTGDVAGRLRVPARVAVTKVPEITAWFWLAKVASTGMGTAFTMKIGFFSSAVIFLVLIAVPAVSYRWLAMNSVLAFWFAYTLTRPLGASIADWLGVPASIGGLAWGRGVVALVLTVPILIAVVYVAVTHVDVARGPQVLADQPARARHRAV